MLTTASSVKNCITGFSPFGDAFSDARILESDGLAGCVFELSERIQEEPTT